MPFVLATYNVKNLFDAASDAERPLWDRKLERLADTLRACNADVVGLQEVGSPGAARKLVSGLGDLGYGEPTFATPDARGIRCALVSRFPVAFAHVLESAALPFPTFALGDPPPFDARIPLRRGVVHAGIEAPAMGLVHVLVAHLKSPRPLGVKDASGRELAGDGPHDRAEDFVRTVVWRLAESLFLREQVDGILARDEAARIALVGDLNDVPQSATLSVLRGESAGTGALFDCTERIEPACRFSIVHEARPSQVDHILATAGLYASLRGARFLNATLRDHGPARESDGEAMTVDSDHAPLVAFFD
jgi:endonuclease/exonuclease/phosphatase family metal-dependent hydrolase